MTIFSGKVDLGQGLLVGGLQPVIEVGQSRVSADQLLHTGCGFGAVDRHGRRCRARAGKRTGTSAGHRMVGAGAAGAQNQCRDDDRDQPHTC